MPLFSLNALPSIRSKTAKLVLACALPTLVGLVALTWDMYQRVRADVVADADRTAQSLMLAVERDLENGETAARALASSPSLASADLLSFHTQARSILRPQFPAFAFVLSNAAGQPLLNTRVPYGNRLPATGGNAATIARVFASGEAATSDLYRAEPSQPQVLSIDVPVWRAGVVAYVLSVQFRPERLLALLEEQHLPPGWTAQVFDNQQVIVARSRQHARFVGLTARPEMMGALRKANLGMFEMTSREGEPILAVFSRSTRRGWSASIGVPRDAARNVLFSSLNKILLSVASLLAAGFLVAWTIGGTIGRSVRALCAPAVALGRGEPLVFPRFAIREAAEVATALQQVESELVRYRAGLEALVRERTAELVRSNALLETVYASAPVGLCFLDTELRFVMVNEYLAAINGQPVAAHLGRTLPDILGPAGTQFESAYRHVLATGQPLVEVHASGAVPASPDAERHWIVSYYPVFGPDHAIVGITGVVLDVSERKLLDQRMRDHDEQFRALYELGGDAHTLVTLGAGFVGGNKAAVAMFGCDSVEEFTRLSPATASPPLQPDGRRSDEKAQACLRAALEHGSNHFEWLHQRRDGTVFHADVLLTSLNIGGKGVIQATVRDISARIAADAALRATSAQLEHNERFIRTVTDNLPGMVGYWDRALRCRFANRLYLAWFGRTSAQMIGKSMDEVHGAELMEASAPYLRGVFNGKAQQFERELVNAAGEVRNTWASYIPDFDEAGAVRGFFVLNSDISALKRTELRLQTMNEQLVQALEQAESASSAKSDFVANMSHEIRTPMNAIMGLARLLEEAPLERRERGYVAKMKMSTQSLLGILNNVLDFSKIEAGQLVLEHTSFRLEQVLASISVLLATSAWDKGLEPIFAVAPDVPLVLVGDPMRLEQVLLNLVSNAIKFSEQGEVLLAIRTVRADAPGVVLEFSVRDSGIGIAPGQQLHIFDAFSQGDSSTSRKYGGTGLGLAICRRLVNLMGGEIGVTSQLGSGSNFHFHCAFGSAADACAAALPPLPGLVGLKVLVADDNVSANAALSASCRGFGWTVDSVHGGAEALECLRSATAAQQPYGLMFLDSAMPGLDGISVLTYARADPAIVLPKFALMVADHARDRLLGLAEELQLDAVLSKPITPAALAEAIGEAWSGKPRSVAEPGMAPLAGRLHGIRVLLVEDNQINQEVAKYILLHTGASVDTAGNGKIALGMLADAPGRYDAVLMDIQMPVMNGYEATAAIRAMGLRDLPIVAMTANAMEEDRQHAIEVGMNAHVAKPIDVDQLVDTLKRVTVGADLRELEDPVRPADQGAALPPAPLPAPIPGIDLRTTLPRFGGNFGNFVALLKRFERSHGNTVDQVRDLLRGADRHGAIQRVHRLRGVAANLGADQVASIALDLEQALKQGSDARLPACLDSLETALEVVMEAARELPAQAYRPGPAVPAPDLQAALAKLLTLLQNSNLKAMSEFAQLQPALASVLAPELALALSDAVETLSFASAAALLQDILNRKDIA